MDDILLPDSLHKQRCWLDNHPEYGMVRTNGWYTFENNMGSDKLLCPSEDARYYLENTNIFDRLFYGYSYPYPGTYMIRTSAYDSIYRGKGIFPSRYGQNSQLLLPIAYKYKVGYINEPLMKYTVRSDSLSHSSQPEKQLMMIKGFCEIGKEINRIIFSGDEKAYWDRKVELLYAENILMYAYYTREKETANKYYNVLVHYSKVSLKHRFYCSVTNSPYMFYCVIRMFNRAIGVLYRLLHRVIN